MKRIIKILLGFIFVISASTFAFPTDKSSWLSGIFDADDISDGSTNAIPTLTQESNWDTAYGWGNHADAGYLVDGDFATAGFMVTDGAGNYSIDNKVYIEGNESITLSGDISGTGATSITTAIGDDKITEAMLKAVNAAADEDILTYEATTGDFEYQTPSETITAGNNLTWTGTTIDLDAAVVLATGSIKDSSGTVTLGGTGNTNNETLTLNCETTANTIAMGTGSGVTTLNTTAIKYTILKFSLTQVSEDADFDSGEVLSTGIASGYGLIFVTEETTGECAIFKISNVTIASISASGNWTTTKDTGSKLNVYWETDQVKVQNKIANNLRTTVGIFAVKSTST
jgi:hypothetical protein